MTRSLGYMRPLAIWAMQLALEREDTKRKAGKGHRKKVKEEAKA